MTLDITKAKQDLQSKEMQNGVSLKNTSLISQAQRVKKPRTGTIGEGTVLLADTSSSMAGEKIAALKEAVLEFIDDDLKIFEFNSYIQQIHDRVTLQNVEAHGSTHLLEALSICYNENPTTIILVTDGQPTDSSPGPILDLAQSKGVPIQCVMLPGNVNKEFLEDLTRVSGGSVVTEVKDLKLLGQTLAGLIEHKPNGKAIKL